MRDVFISYSRNDLESVLKIKDELENNTGLEYWMDLNGVDSGSEQFTDDIVRAINDCRIFLFMLSDYSQKSKFALRELNFAYHKAKEDGKKVVIVNINACVMSDNFLFMYGLTDIIDWNNSPQREKLIKDLKKWTNYIQASDKDNLLFNFNGVELKMVFVRGGTFQMGATPEQGNDVVDSEKPVHQVTLSDYFIEETPVTQKLWKEMMGSNPSFFKGEELPVERISWDDCQKFIKKLNEITGKEFRLPTEAEWEFAARGGGRSNGYKFAGSDTLKDVGWYHENSRAETHPVKMKSPNELGLYDMCGNVCEWCSDWYGGYNGLSQNNPQGPSSGAYRVVRGGNWNYFARFCRVSNRFYYRPGEYYSYYGFRLALASMIGKLE